MSTNAQLVKSLIDLVAEERIVELTIREPHWSIRVVRRADGAAKLCTETPATGGHAAAPRADNVTSTDQARPIPLAAHTVKAPMSGTLYRSTSPGGELMVQAGTRVAAGTPVCVIDVMKILNEIVAGQAGTVVQVLCEDGQGVEQGQALFVVQPDEGPHVP